MKFKTQHMKYKSILIVISLLLCMSVFGQQKKTVPMTVQPQKTEVQVLEETVLQLQAENQAIHKQLESMEKEIEICREDVRHKESTINDNQGHWLTILSIVIGTIVTILGVGLGVVAPLVLNARNDKKQKEIIEKIRTELKNQIESAQEDAKSAKESLSAVTELKVDIDNIKKDIDKSKKAAERAAKRAVASKLFAQALSEKNSLKAIALYSKALEIMPNLAEVYNNRGVRKEELGDKDGAMKDYNRSIELDPTISATYNNRGILKKAMGDKEGALEDYNKAVELDPKNAEVINYRGILKKEKGDYVGAMKDYDMAIELQSNCAMAYNNRADLWLIMGEIARALNDANIAIEKDNKEFVCYVTRGEVYMALGELNKAIVDFNHALSINVGIKEAYENRAKCFRKLAESVEDPSKKAELITKAEADEKKAESLK